MSKLLLLHSPHFTPIHRRSITSILSKPNVRIPPSFSPPQYTTHLYHHHHRQIITLSGSRSVRRPFPSPIHSRNFSVRAFDSSSETKTEEEKELEVEGKKESENGSVKKKTDEEEYPSGEFEFKKIGGWNSFLVKLRMLIAFPWERVRKGSVLNMKLRGQVFLSFPCLSFLFLNKKIALFCFMALKKGMCKF